LLPLPPLLLVRQLPMLVWLLLVLSGMLMLVLLTRWLSAPAAAPLYNDPSTWPIRQPCSGVLEECNGAEQQSRMLKATHIPYSF
jgi:hypothetical protein